MYGQVEKPKENRGNSRAVGKSVVQKKENGAEGFGFVDNRIKPIAYDFSVSKIIQKKESNVRASDDFSKGKGHGNMPITPVVQKVEVEKWKEIQNKVVMGKMLKTIFSNKDTRRKILSIHGLNVVSDKDLLWRPSKRESVFEKYVGQVAEKDLKENALQAITENSESHEVVKDIQLTYRWLYSGNPENPMSEKMGSVQISEKEIQEGDKSKLLEYLKRIEGRSRYPIVDGFSIDLNGEGKYEFKDINELMKGLQTFIITENVSTLTVEPIVLPLGQLEKHFSQVAKDFVKSGKPLYEPTHEELEHLDNMHGKKLSDDRNPQILDELYRGDTLARVIAKNIGGKAISMDLILSINKEIQGSGTNKELNETSDQEGGKLRTKEVSLPGITLTQSHKLKLNLARYSKKYNEFVSKLQGRNIEESGGYQEFYMHAIQFHQGFISIHPFTNGNGRVARVLLYNLFLAAGLPLFPIDPSSDTYKATSGMELKGTLSAEEMVSYMMSKHLLFMKRIKK